MEFTCTPVCVGFLPRGMLLTLLVTSTAFLKTSCQVLCQFVTTTQLAVPLTGQDKQSQPLLGDPLSCFRPFCTRQSPSEASLVVKQREQRVKHAVSMPFLFLSSTKPAALMENKDVKPGALLCAMQELPSVEGRPSPASSATPPTV